MAHAGELKDTPAGRRKYLEYLGWLAEDEAAQKELRFSEMSKGWLIGAGEFARAMIRAQQAGTGRGRVVAATMRVTQEAMREEQFEGPPPEDRKDRESTHSRRKVRRMETRAGGGAQSSDDRNEPVARRDAAPG